MAAKASPIKANAPVGADSRGTNRRPAGLGAAAPLAANGARSAAPPPAAAAAAAAPPPPAAVLAKVALNGDTRLVVLAPEMTYAGLLDAVQRKFPGAGPVLIAHTDAAGATTSIADSDGILALLRAAAAAPAPSSVKLQLTPCKQSELPPVPPADAEAVAVARKRHDEAQARGIAQLKQQLDDMEEKQRRPLPQVAVTPSGARALVDEWLMDFAAAFREASGLDADRHIEPFNNAWAALSRAMEAGTADAEAGPLFGEADAAFGEVAAAGLQNWGQVHMCRARAALEGPGAGADAPAMAAEEFGKAEARFHQSLACDPENYSALMALGQLELERAKVAAGYVLAPAAAGDAQVAALSRVTSAGVAAAAPHAAAAEAYFARAAAAGATADGTLRGAAAAASAPAEAAAGDEGADAEGSGDGGDGDAEGGPGFEAQALLAAGNCAYEWSQLLAAAGDEGWRAQADAAAAKFRAGACAEEDIVAALRAHCRAAELGYAPEDAPPEGPPTPGAGPREGSRAARGAAGDGAEAKAKGLPALGGKKK